MKKKVLFFILFFVLIFGSGYLLSQTVFDPPLVKTAFTFEYGEKVEIDKQDLFGDAKNVADVLLWEKDALPQEKDQVYPKIGEYMTNVTYHVGSFTRTASIQIVIQDTIAPQITMTEEEISVAYGESDHDFYAYVQVHDKSKTSFSIDVSQVDFETSGTYSANVVASDVAGNQATKEFRVIVEEKPQPVLPQTSEASQTLQEILQRYGGNVGIYYKDLQTNETFIYNDVNFYPCSFIKFTVLLAVYDQASKGMIDLEAYRYYLDTMVVLSLNDSYNTILQMLGNGDGLAGATIVNDYLRSLGITRTQVHHALQPAQADFSDGGSNVSCASDLGILFEKLYRYELFSPQTSEEVLQLLKRCADLSALWQGLPANTAFAHKSGCAYDYYHDGGIVYGTGHDYILVVMSDGIVDKTSFFYEISNYFYYY